MTYIIAMPALAIVIAAYMVVGASGGMMLDADVYAMTLASGASFALRLGDLFVIAGLAALFVEMIKAGRAGRSTVADHMFSTLVFVAAIVCFLLVDVAGTSTFLILTLMALIDVVAGFSISILTARRDFSIGGDA